MATDINKINELTIGELAKATETKVQTIRYYEQMGMLPTAARTEGNQRRYTPETVTRLRFIRHARDLGFSQDDVRQFLSMSGKLDAPCVEADAIARRHLEEVRRKIAMLKGLEKELVRMTCDSHHGTIADCRVIETLGDHSHCRADHQHA